MPASGLRSEFGEDDVEVSCADWHQSGDWKCQFFLSVWLAFARQGRRQNPEDFQFSLDLNPRHDGEAMSTKPARVGGGWIRGAIFALLGMYLPFVWWPASTALTRVEREFIWEMPT